MVYLFAAIGNTSHLLNQSTIKTILIKHAPSLNAHICFEGKNLYIDQITVCYGHFCTSAHPLAVMIFILLVTVVGQ